MMSIKKSGNDFFNEISQKIRERIDTVFSKSSMNASSTHSPSSRSTWEASFSGPSTGSSPSSSSSSAVSSSFFEDHPPMSWDK